MCAPDSSLLAPPFGPDSHVIRSDDHASAPAPITPAIRPSAWHPHILRYLPVGEGGSGRRDSTRATQDRCGAAVTWHPAPAPFVRRRHWPLRMHAIPDADLESLAETALLLSR